MTHRYIPRLIQPLVLRLAKRFPALALSGPRQSGKSTLLKKLFSDTHRYVSFDDPVTLERAVSDPRLFLESLGRPVILDEVQYAPQLMSYVKMAIDQDRAAKGRFIFTGSQQFLMIKNLGDSLAGRIALLDLLPFQVEEKKRVPGLRKPLATTLGAFVHACLVGSYPEVTLDSKIDLQAWYGAYLRTYLERDIRTLYNIGSLRDFQRFLQLLASRTAQILNLTSLANDLGVSVNTVKQWISILEAGQIIYLLPPYYENFGKRVTKAPKIYFLDCGLVCFLTGVRDQDHLLKGPMAGSLFETFCIQETLKTLLFQGERPRLFYFRSYQGLEIDLLIEKSLRELVLAEIKLTKTPRREMAANLERFGELFPKIKILEGKILTLSENKIPLAKNIFAEGLYHHLSTLAV